MRFFLVSVFTFFFSRNEASAEVERGYADLVDELLPAVVSIATSQIVERRASSLPELPEGHPFNDMFKDFFGNQMPKRENMTGLGSGFIISQDGYVVTNYHVISGADQITVIFNNGIDEVPAELVGTDPKTDIAVLKIDPEAVEIQPVSWGDSEISRVGDIVLAIGNPLGLGGTVTSGIISSINRDIGGGPYVDFIQTDASINRGNSGGPLFDLDGNVIGINSMILSPSGGSIGLGFAIPSNLASNIIEQLKTTGEIKRAWLGVRIQEVTDEISKSVGLKKTYGALVQGLTPDSPAALAGVKEGDIIVEFNDKEVVSQRVLPKLVADAEIGQPANVKIWRNEQFVNLSVTLGLQPTAEVLASIENNISIIPIKELGIRVRSISSDDRAKLKLNNSLNGVIIDDIDSDSFLVRQGISVDDIIIEIQGKQVQNSSDLLGVINDVIAQGKENVLLVFYAGQNAKKYIGAKLSVK